MFVIWKWCWLAADPDGLASAAESAQVPSGGILKGPSHQASGEMRRGRAKVSAAQAPSKAMGPDGGVLT